MVSSRNETTGRSVIASAATAARRHADALFFFLWIAAATVKQYGVVFDVAVRPGPWLWLYTPLALLLLLGWLWTLPRRAALSLALLFDLLLSVLFLGDVLYARTFDTVMPFASLSYAGQTGKVADSIGSLLRRTDLLYFADLPLLVGLWYARDGRFASMRRWTLKGAGLVAASSLVLTALLMIADPVRDKRHDGQLKLVGRFGPVYYHLLDIGRFAGRKLLAETPTETEVARVREVLAKERDARPGPLVGAARGLNLIAIQMESINSFVIGLEVGGEMVAPNLTRLAKESLYFTDFWSQAGHGMTSDAELLVHSSLYPLFASAAYFDYPDHIPQGFPMALREAGYTSVAINGGTADFWNRSMVYPRLGFERFLCVDDFVNDEPVRFGVGDGSFFRQVEPKLLELKSPFYAFLESISTHHPYQLGPRLPLPLSAGELSGTIVSDYAEAVRMTDAVLGRFIEKLKENGLASRTLLVIYGDHGAPGIDRKSLVGHLLEHVPTSEFEWTRFERRVPLLIHFPGGAHAGTHEELCGELDLAPTLLSLFGVEADGYTFFGQDALARGGVPLVVLPDGSAADGVRFWSANGGKERSGECYDYQTRQRLSRGDCQELVARAAKDQEASRDLLQRDMAGMVVAHDAP